MVKYLLIGCHERDINTPEFFDTYKEAFSKMCEYLASACGETVEDVIQIYDKEDPDGRTGLFHHDAWTERYGQNFDWRIFCVVL